MIQSGTMFLLDNITVIALLASIIIFSMLSLQSKSMRSFQFQISIFAVIWIVGELVSILHENNALSKLGWLGMTIHVSSMVFLFSMLFLRFYYSKRSGKKLVEGFEEYENQ